MSQEENERKQKIFGEIGRRLRLTRIFMGFDRQSDFGRALGGVPQTTISSAERGLNLPSPAILQALAQDHWINVSWLLTGRGEMFIRDAEHPGPVIPPPEMGGVLPEGVTRAEFGQPRDSYRVSQIVEAGYEEIDREDPRLALPGFPRLPIIDHIAAGPAAGTGLADAFVPGDAASFITYSGRMPPDAFALKVSGDSMEPEYRHRDLVIVDPTIRPESGEACVVYKDAAGERLARLKVLRRRGRRLWLESLNPAYKPIELDPADLIAAFGIYAHVPWVSRRRRRP
jgi:SOS-response transcriptional repressor LexA